MIARMHNTNGHANGTLPAEIVDQVFELDRDYFERRQNREAVSTQAARCSLAAWPLAVSRWMAAVRPCRASSI